MKDFKDLLGKELTEKVQGLDIVKSEHKEIYSILKALGLLTVIDEVVISPKRVDIFCQHTDITTEDFPILAKAKMKIRIMSSNKGLRFLFDK